jgi:hypothetical protein
MHRDSKAAMTASAISNLFGVLVGQSVIIPRCSVLRSLFSQVDKLRLGLHHKLMWSRRSGDEGRTSFNTFPRIFLLIIIRIIERVEQLCKLTYIRTLESRIVDPCHHWTELFTDCRKDDELRKIRNWVNDCTLQGKYRRYRSKLKQAGT